MSASRVCRSSPVEEDCEFVECMECREVFDLSELKDMAIEEQHGGRSFVKIPNSTHGDELRRQAARRIRVRAQPGR